MKNRTVKITSLSFQAHPAEEILGIVWQEAEKGCDLIVLPETWTGDIPETIEEGTTAQLQKIAKAYGLYIINAVSLKTAERPRRNSAILIDRKGEIQGIYNKMYPFWSEFDQDPKIFIGEEAPVFQTDFGRIGMAICFDANFNGVWERLADQQADIVLWSSAYSGGTSLKAHALNYNYAIVSSTLAGDCVVYDIDGTELFYQKANQGEVLVSNVELSTNRAVFHENYNMEGREKLLKAHGDQVFLEKELLREQWFVLKGSPQIQVKVLAKEYGLEELPAYKRRSRDAIDKMRAAQREIL